MIEFAIKSRFTSRTGSAFLHHTSRNRIVIQSLDISVKPRTKGYSFCYIREIIQKKEKIFAFVLMILIFYSYFCPRIAGLPLL